MAIVLADNTPRIEYTVPEAKAYMAARGIVVR